MTPIPGRRAVFLDRDGVLNRNVFYPDTSSYESPRVPAHFMLVPGVPAALTRLRQAGYLLFLVSNQPNAVNGKSSRVDLSSIHGLLEAELEGAGVQLDASFYCYHHPTYSGPCACRKPGNYFLTTAATEYGLNLASCWMIGDRETDVICGQVSGTRTIWIDNQEGNKKVEVADYCVSNLSEAVQWILGD